MRVFVAIFLSAVMSIATFGTMTASAATAPNANDHISHCAEINEGLRNCFARYLAEDSATAINSYLDADTSLTNKTDIIRKLTRDNKCEYTKDSITARPTMSTTATYTFETEDDCSRITIATHGFTVNIRPYNEGYIFMTEWGTDIVVSSVAYYSYEDLGFPENFARNVNIYSDICGTVAVDEETGNLIARPAIERMSTTDMAFAIHLYDLGECMWGICDTPIACPDTEAVKTDLVFINDTSVCLPAGEFGKIYIDPTTVGYHVVIANNQFHCDTLADIIAALRN